MLLMYSIFSNFIILRYCKPTYKDHDEKINGCRGAQHVPNFFFRKKSLAEFFIDVLIWCMGLDLFLIFSLIICFDMVFEFVSHIKKNLKK